MSIAIGGVAVILNQSNRLQMNKKLRKQLVIAAAILIGFVVVMMMLSQLG